MSYLAFLIVLILAGIVFGLARLIGSRVSFDEIFKVIAYALVMMPIVFWMFLLCIALALGLSLVIAGVLEATGLFPMLAGWPMWKWFPPWLWLVLGGVAVAGAGSLYELTKWLRVRRKGIARP